MRSLIAMASAVVVTTAIVSDEGVEFYVTDPGLWGVPC